MNKEKTSEWQVDDGKFVMPWFTHPFLEELRQWHLGDVVWLEFGAGRSTAWLRNRCAWVDSVEANYGWAQVAIEECEEHGLTNGRIMANNLREGVPNDYPLYVEMIPTDKKYNIISVDGIFRTEMVERAINYFKNSAYGGILIMDNLDQDFVWISPRAMSLLETYDVKRYVQPDHTDHEGKPWNTSCVYIKPEKAV